MSSPTVPEITRERVDALDPWSNPEPFRKVRRKRVTAHLVDLCVVVFFWLTALGPMVVLGLITGGAAFLLLPALWIGVVLAYAWFTLAKTGQTVGMKIVDLRLLRADGGRVDTWTALAHPILFWAASAALTPLILLVGLFNEKKRLLHDFVLGTVVVHDPPGERP